MRIQEGILSFDFETDDGSLVSKYDDWIFYRHHFCKLANGVKAVDFVYVDQTQRCTWLIEVKDYRHPQTEQIKPSELADAVALKVRDTLAGLVAAKCNANKDEERDLSCAALTMNKFNVVLHMEQIKRVWSIDPADLQLKLKQKLKAVDAHSKVVSKDSLKSNMRWSIVQSVWIE